MCTLYLRTPYSFELKCVVLNPTISAHVSSHELKAGVNECFCIYPSVRPTMSPKTLYGIFNLTNISLASFLCDIGRKCKTRSDATNVASDQVLHCLLTEVYFKVLIKMKNATQQP